MLLPSGFQLERARALLADRSDIGTDDIKEFISLSSARAARLQRITRWAVAAVAAIILIAGATVGYLQWDKARQLAGQEVALAHAQANILAELSAAKLSHNDFDSALRLAARGTRIDLALPTGKTRASPAAAALAAAVSQANWRFALGGHASPVTSAAFSPDGSRIVTASDDKTARIWDAASAKEIAVLRGHGTGMFSSSVHSAVFSPDGSRIVTASEDNIALAAELAGRSVAIFVTTGGESAALAAKAATSTISPFGVL